MSTVFSTTAKQASIMAVSAALYAVFFVFSKLVPGLPSFTVLYLPVILLGVFPVWFGKAGLLGGMIGAYIGGIVAENLAFHIAWAESVTTLIIYSLNWFFITRSAAEVRSKKGIVALCSVYALTLLAGTSYILWQLAVFGIFPMEIVLETLLPTYALNLPIMLIVCPTLLRRVSPKIKAWGVYSGSFWEWRSKRTATAAKSAD